LAGANQTPLGFVREGGARRFGRRRLASCTLDGSVHVGPDAKKVASGADCRHRGAVPERSARRCVEAEPVLVDHTCAQVERPKHGRYDIVVVAEAPDAETMLASAAGIAGAGNNRTETLRAFTLDEVELVLKKVGPA
jgi:hypothetical protein